MGTFRPKVFNRLSDVAQHVSCTGCVGFRKRRQTFLSLSQKISVQNLNGASLLKATNLPSSALKFYELGKHPSDVFVKHGRCWDYAEQVLKSSSQYPNMHEAGSKNSYAVVEPNTDKIHVIGRDEFLPQQHVQC